ncbi:MAG: alpha/beta hydrolase [Chloroflexota bacterium]|nr:alpha/beta hydrolase [Chloroflexota bacterium]
MNSLPNHTTGYVEVPGARLYYEVAGEGHPLVLLHAGIADNTMWDPQFLLFAEKYRVIRYDTRGFGKSQSEEVSFSNRQDLYALLTHLGVEKAYVLGVSRGSQIAIDFTLEHPETVAALIPVGPGLGGIEEEPTPTEIELFDQTEAAEKAEDWPQVADLDVRLWVDGPDQPSTRVASEVREKVRAMSLHNYTTHKSQGIPQPLDPPAHTRLAQISVPTLVIWGDLDLTEVQIAGPALTQGIKGARQAVIHNTAHLPSMEQPAQFNRLVLDFLAGLTGS